MTFEDWKQTYSPHVLTMPTGARKVFNRTLTAQSRRAMFRLEDMVVLSAVSGPAYVLVPRNKAEG